MTKLSQQTANIGQLIRPNKYRLSAIVNWAIVNSVDPTGSVIVCGDRHNLVSLFARAAGMKTLNYASTRQVRHNGLWYWLRSLKVGYQNHLVGSSPLDICLSPKVLAGMPDLGAKSTWIRKRTLDDLCLSLKKLSWLHISHIEPMELLSGAAQLLTRDQPVITLSAQAIQTFPDDGIDQLHSVQYALFDSNLDRLDGPHISSYHNPFLIAVPLSKQSWMAKIKQSLGFNDSTPASVSIDGRVELIKRYYLRLLRSQSLAADYLKPCLYSDNHIKPIDELVTNGLYPMETHGDEQWCWTGPEKLSTIQIAIPAPGYYHFRLVTGDLPGSLRRNRLRLFLDGQLVANEDVQSHSVVEFSAYFELQEFKENAMVTLCVEDLFSTEDKRLGISIVKLEMYVPQDEFL